MASFFNILNVVMGMMDESSSDSESSSDEGGNRYDVSEGTLRRRGLRDTDSLDSDDSIGNSNAPLTPSTRDLIGSSDDRYRKQLQGGRSGTIDDAMSTQESTLFNALGHKVPSLLDLSARAVARICSCETLEFCDPPLDEALLRKVAFWAFPTDKSKVRAYANMTDQFRAWNRGKDLVKEGRVKEMWQVGFMATAYLVKFRTDDASPSDIRVSLTFEQQRILSSTCSECKRDIWCAHVVAAVLFRMTYPDRVTVHAPMTETLSTLDRFQLQKVLQYAVQEDPAGILGKVFKHIDAVRDTASEINLTEGAPDPTFGGLQLDKTHWQLSVEVMEKTLQKSLSTLTSGTNFSWIEPSSTRNKYYPDSFDLHKKQRAHMAWYNNRVIELVRNEEYLHATQVLVTIMENVKTRLKQVSEINSRNLKRYFHDLCRFYALAMVYIQERDQAAWQILVNAIPDINTPDIKVYKLKTSLWAECPPLSSAALGENLEEGEVLYEPVAASKISSPPPQFYQFLDDNKPIEDSQYEESIPVMAARLQALNMFGKTHKHYYMRMIRLALKLLEQLSKRARKYSILGEYLAQLTVEAGGNIEDYLSVSFLAHRLRHHSPLHSKAEIPTMCKGSNATQFDSLINSAAGSPQAGSSGIQPSKTSRKSPRGSLSQAGNSGPNSPKRRKVESRVSTSEHSGQNSEQNPSTSGSSSATCATSDLNTSSSQLPSTSQASHAGHGTVRGIMRIDPRNRNRAPRWPISSPTQGQNSPEADEDKPGMSSSNSGANLSMEVISTSNLATPVKARKRKLSVPFLRSPINTRAKKRASTGPIEVPVKTSRQSVSTGTKAKAKSTPTPTTKGKGRKSGTPKGKEVARKKHIFEDDDDLSPKLSGGQISYCLLYYVHCVIRYERKIDQKICSEQLLMGYILLALEMGYLRTIARKDEVSMTEQNWLWRLETSMCEYMQRKFNAKSISVQLYMQAFDKIGLGFYGNSHPLVLIDNLTSMIHLSDQKHSGKPVMELMADLLNAVPDTLDAYTLPVTPKFAAFIDNGSEYRKNTHMDFVMYKIHSIASTFLSHIQLSGTQAEENNRHRDLLIQILHNLCKVESVVLLNLLVKDFKLHLYKLKGDPLVMQALLTFTIKAYSRTRTVHQLPIDSVLKDKTFLFSLADNLGIASLKLFKNDWELLFTLKEVKELIYLFESQIRAMDSPPEEVVEWILQVLKQGKRCGIEACDLLSLFKVGGTTYQQALTRILENRVQYESGTLLAIAQYHWENTQGPNNDVGVKNAHAVDNDVDDETMKIIEAAIQQIPLRSGHTSEQLDWLYNVCAVGTTAKEISKSSRFVKLLDLLSKYANKSPEVLLRILQNVEKTSSLLRHTAVLSQALVDSYLDYFSGRIFSCSHSSYNTVINEMLRAKLDCKHFLKDGEAQFDEKVVIAIRTQHRSKKKFIRMLDVEFPRSANKSRK